MISVLKAHKLLEKHTPLLNIENISPLAALGRRLCAAVRSASDSPRFDNSAMDGYAMKAADLKGASELKPVGLKVIAVIAAGKTLKRPLKKGECCKIMTGAPLPAGADTVVQQELSSLKGKTVTFTAAPGRGSNVRKRGEELKKGSLLLKKGVRLNSRSIALLCSSGVAKVSVRRRPVVAVFSTGSELVSPGTSAGPGKIFDSNGPMLAALVEEQNAGLVHQGRLADTRWSIENALKGALEKSDVLIVAGGVSVGDYDFVKDAFKKLNIKEIFWRVAQKPGKPLFAGIKGRKLVFGLPGNPAAAWTCFDEYVRPALKQMQGLGKGAGWHPARMAEAVANPGKRDTFYKARFGKGGLTVSDGQGSHMLKSLAEADALLYLPAGQEKKKGQKVLVRRLKGGRGAVK